MDEQEDVGGVATEEQPIAFNWDESIKTLPEDIRESPVIKQTKDFTSLAKQLVHAEKMVGSSFQMPKEGDTSGWDSVYKKLGRPEDAKDYAFAREEGVEVNEVRENAFREAAHKAGLNNTQVQQIIKWDADQQKAGVVQYNADLQTATNALKEEWGADFENRLNVAENALNTYASEEDVKRLKSLGVTNDTGFIKAMYEAGKGLAESRNKGDGKTAFGVMTPEEAIKELDKLSLDKDFMESLLEKGPGNKAAVKKQSELYKLAYPDMIE